MSDAVTICECFARDGLQHEPEPVPTATKIALLNSFARTGFRRIEATSYSHPARVPGFSDASEVLAGIDRRPGVAFKATCPNPRAVERALADLEAGHGAEELSLLVSATEAHTERNLRTTRAGQWERVTEMVKLADGRFRLVGVVSVAFGCPFEGKVDPGRVAEDVARFADLGASLVTLGDTTGVATPGSVRALYTRLSREHPDLALVAHLHNTRGTGIANAVAALDAGSPAFRFRDGRRRRASGEDRLRGRAHRQRVHRGPGQPVRRDGRRNRPRSGPARRGVRGLRRSARPPASQHGRPRRLRVRLTFPMGRNLCC